MPAATYHNDRFFEVSRRARDGYEAFKHLAWLVDTIEQTASPIKKTEAYVTAWSKVHLNCRGCMRLKDEKAGELSSPFCQRCTRERYMPSIDTERPLS